ncbi:FAD-binding domain-containing protein [Schizophyllum commune H4-8]|uniref:FAD-binding domain-containing protein n=1 Tax=Schizophyllum commune (strain H4-8 / FGSC 9210) TaxID=578458 RepID=UPI00215F4A4C|nr:FAD-binding domain-containing protein [Schizophyllum commune H4-8]KAI5892434.1 FAD-binding domain-containing protein [Schizophyllum commune H4-8]
MTPSRDLPEFPPNFKGDIVLRGDPSYPDAIRRWARSAERQAAIVAYIKDSADTAIALAYARQHGLPIAIKGGGHSSAGASSVEDGLVIDCSRYMNYCHVDAERKIARVGGGATWETVDTAAYKHGLSIVGGTVNDTGVAGLTLGGGFGFLSGQYGLAIDNLLEVTIVTADGSTLLASPTEHPDLFFGIRGGGSNFGVVTEFVFRANDQKRLVFTGLVTFPTTAYSSVVEAFQQYWDAHDPKACAFLALGATAKSGILCMLFYDGSEEEGRAHFKTLFDIGPSSDRAKATPYDEVNGILGKVFPPGRCDYQKSIACPIPTVPLANELIQRIDEFDASEGPSLLAVFYAWPQHAIAEHRHQDCAFRHNLYPELVFIAQYMDNTPDNKEVARARVRELHGIVSRSEIVSGMSLSERAGYGNHDAEAASSDLERRAQSSRDAFGDVYPRLQKIKKMYDPDMVFDRWRPIQPA